MYQPVLITDLDGTLFHSMPIAWEYLNRVAIKYGKKLANYTNYSSIEYFYLDVIKIFGLRSLKLMPRMRRYMYLNDTRIEMYQGAIQGLEILKKLGWRVIVITDNDVEYAKKVFARYGIVTDDEWLEIRSAETESKTSLYYKAFKQFYQHHIFFASHDNKDFTAQTLATCFSFKRVTRIFTPNEIDKKSMVKRKLTIQQFAQCMQKNNNNFDKAFE